MNRRAVKRRGSIIILVLWVVLFLSVLVGAVSSITQRRLQVLERLQTRQQLRYIAEAGVKKAMHLVLTEYGGAQRVHGLADRWNSDEALFKAQRVGDGFFSVVSRDAGSVRYGVTDEERKIDVNRVHSPITLTRLFQAAAGLSASEARALAVSIADWTDEDSNEHDQGAEDVFYMSRKPSYRPANQPLRSLEELLWVKGMSKEIFERLTPYLTLDGSDAININTAAEPVLRAWGFGDSLVKKLALFRIGPDQALGTSDDGEFRTLQGIADVLAQYVPLDDAERQSLIDFAESGTLVVSSKRFLVTSVAQLDGQAMRLSVHWTFDHEGRLLRTQETFSTA